MFAVPALDGRNVTWQVAVLVEPERLQVLELRVPVAEPCAVKVGVVGLASVSVTVAVQEDA